jgi:tetratricopeptide (TPR) repeat protein
MDVKHGQVRGNRTIARDQVKKVAAVAGLMMSLTLGAGCAVVEPTKAESVAVPASAEFQTTVTRLEEGRAGFVIREAPVTMMSWRDDFERAVDLMQAGREEQAVPLLEKIVQLSPGVTAPYINLARAYRHAEQFDSAETMILKALELVPGHPVANNEYGLLLRQTGRFAEARDIYQATLRMYPEYLPVRRNLGILCELYLNDTACAVEQYAIYRESNPDDQDVALWIADLNLRMGRN